MDQNQNNPSIQGLISQQQKQELAQAPSLIGLPVEDQQKKVDAMAKTVLQRVFSRIVQVLTNQDMHMIATLDKDDTTGNVVKYFLMTKVPNLEAIIQEEIELMKKETTTLQQTS